jgi:hypothetical protein
MKKNVKVKSSSSSDIYQVTLKNENGLVSLNCTCQAGIHKMICKHRTSLLEGDVSNLLSESDTSVVLEFIESIEDVKIANLFSGLYEIEEEIKRLNNIKKKIRKDIGFKFSDGF